MFCRRLLHISVLVLFFLVGVALAWAQATTSIRGTVADPSGAIVPGVSVTLENVGTNAVRNTLTDETGTYQILQVPPGTYRIRAELTGFKTVVNENLQLLVNTPMTLNLKFESVGQLTEIVEVSAQAGPLVNTVDATLGNAFQEQQVKQLPIESRNVVDLLSLQPGVAYTGNRPDINLNVDTRSGAVNGARSDQTTVTMDGVNVTDQAFGYAFTSVVRTTPDSLQEFRVTTINPTATDGNSAGAQVALVTKSGTNQFHGNLYEYLRNTATSANDYFIKLAQLKSGQPNKAPKLNRNVYGGSLGGPIKKDRLFFFVNYEGRKDRQADSVVTKVPTAAARAGSLLYLNSSGGITTIDAATLKQWDPLGIGPNAAVLKYFNSFPLPNDSSVGDLLNYAGHRFAAPSSKDLEVLTTRFDYRLVANGNHNLFFRASGQNDFSNNAPFIPGGPPLTTRADRSKGFALGYTAVLSPSFINEFRWGFTRASVGNFGNSNQANVNLSNFNMGITRTSAMTMPIHHFLDHINWVKGRHTLQFGGGIMTIRHATYNTGTSFSSISVGTTAVEGGGVAFTGGAFDPGPRGFPPVARSFASGYDQASLNLLGILTSGNARYNYDKTGNVLPQGAPIQRHYAMNEYDLFVQDTIQLTPNLTANLGLRYQFETTPYETNGLQVAPNMPLREWFATRVGHMKAGVPANQMPVLSYVLAGRANDGAPFYAANKNNFSPRVSLAYSPAGGSGRFGRLIGDKKTSIRAGAGLVFDHFGTQMINTFDENGAFGLSTSLSSGLGGQAFNCAARITDIFEIPTRGCPHLNNGFLLLPAPPGGFPQTPPVGLANAGFRGIWAIDDQIRTPYAYTLNLSVARQLSSDMSLEVSYVGRLSHRLLTNTDFAGQGNIVDPASGVSGFQALARMSELARRDTPVANITADLVGPTAAFWTNLYAPLAVSFLGNCATPGNCTPLQAAYLLNRRFLYDDTFATFFMDVPGQICPGDCSRLGSYVFWPPQFYRLNAWESHGNASYHAMQVSLRKRFTTSLQFDVNYVWSKSMDLSSDAARVGRGGLKGQVVNAFDRKQLRAVSDFDMTHQFNANWLWELPVGRGKALLANAPGWVNATVGGWQLSGIYRITTGLPFGVDNGNKFATGNANGYAVRVGPVKTATTKTPDGRVLMFADPSAAFKAFDFQYAGQSGDRNVLRGDGYLTLDASLSKRWVMPYKEGHSVQLRWEVFNVGNFSRFNAVSNRPVMTNVTNFGLYTGLLTSPRVMQFALRYDF